jgi:hypothetical protein
VPEQQSDIFSDQSSCESVVYDSLEEDSVESTVYAESHKKSLVTYLHIDQQDDKTSELPPVMMLTPNPSLPDFSVRFKRDIVKLVNSINVHKHTATCYKYSKKHDNPSCRMRMPRAIIEQSSIDQQSGKIKLKRCHEMINNFNGIELSFFAENRSILECIFIMLIL